MSNRNIKWTYFIFFLYCLQIGLFIAESADANITYIRDFCAKDICVRGADTKNVYIEGTNAVKDSKIYL